MSVARSTCLLLAPLATVACAPAVPESPTWADVEPILRGSCTHCHGATAAVDGRGGETVFRFDFFEVSEATCGDAAHALDMPAMAHGLAPLIASSVTPSDPRGRARMPPAPAPQLADWERETLVRWAAQPTRGNPPRDDRRPQITVDGTLASSADDQLDFTVLVGDPDGEAVIGVLTLGDRKLALEGPGAYRVTMSTAGWSAGGHPASASLCDGWSEMRYELPEIVVDH